MGVVNSIVLLLGGVAAVRLWGDQRGLAWLAIAAVLSQFWLYPQILGSARRRVDPPAYTGVVMLSSLLLCLGLFVYSLMS